MRFEACAHSYDQHAKPQRFFAGRVAQFICTGTELHLARPVAILELGAGTGALTRHLCAIGNSSIHATDASPAMVQQGRAAVPGAQWSLLDAFVRPLPGADLQVSSGLLHWADDPVATLVRWKGSLAAGGRMVHAVPCDPCLAEWRAIVPESPVRWRDEASWHNVFEAAGLRVCRSQLWVHRTICVSAIDVVRGFHRSGVTGRVRVGPGRLRRALRAYDEQHHTTDGVNVTWAWLAIEAAA